MRLFDRGGSGDDPVARRRPRQRSPPPRSGQNTKRNSAGQSAAALDSLLLPRARAWRSQRSLTMNDSIRSCKRGAVDIDPISQRQRRRRPPLRPADPASHRHRVCTAGIPIIGATRRSSDEKKQIELGAPPAQRPATSSAKRWPTIIASEQGIGPLSPTASWQFQLQLGTSTQPE
jgi:hypothetical protein